MREPQGFVNGGFEAELAAEAWKVGGNTNTDPFFMWYPPHQALDAAANNPFASRVITARNWITGMRDQSEAWGENGIARVKTYFKQQYGRDVNPTNEVIANVEHFFTSAMITVTFGVFYPIGVAGAATYEIMLQPAFVGLWNFSLRSAWGNFTNGWKQLTGPNQAGVRFALMNSNFTYFDVQQFLNVEPQVLDTVAVPPKDKPKPAPAPPLAVPKTRRVASGEYLSLIAGKIYQNVELWPLLWDLNKSEYPNPNRVPVGAVLKYKDIHEFSQAEISDAKRRSPTWKNYPQ